VLPAIVDNVVRILGPNVMLWGADIITRRPGEAHPWHSYIESAKPANRTVTVWIGLENTTRESSLNLITHSQNFGETIQEVRHRLGRPRDSVTPEEVLRRTCPVARLGRAHPFPVPNRSQPNRRTI
jgi:hypothetical protein